MKEEINNGGPAFPVSAADSNVGHQDGPNTWQYPGMTLCDYFAAKAMQGMWASDTENWCCSGSVDALAVRARNAYAMADAMLKAREAK